MSALQINAFQPAFSLSNTQHSSNVPFRLCFDNSLKIGFSRSVSLKKSCLGLRLQSSTRSSRYFKPVCVFGKGKPGIGDGFNPLEYVGKAFENMKDKRKDEEKLEDLDKRMRAYEESYGADGKGGGGGGGSGDGEQGGRSEEEEPPGETLQIIAASLILIYLYRLIVDGEGTIAITKDIFKLFLLKGPSNRMKEKASKLQDWMEACVPDNVYKEPDPYWLEHAILNTDTLWDDSRDIFQGKNARKEGKIEQPKPPPKKIEKRRLEDIDDGFDDGFVVDRGFSDDDDEDEDKKILEENQNEKVEVSNLGQSAGLSDYGDNNAAELTYGDDNKSSGLIDYGENKSDELIEGDDNSDGMVDGADDEAIEGDDNSDGLVDGADDEAAKMTDSDDESAESTYNEDEVFSEISLNDDESDRDYTGYYDDDESEFDEDETTMDPDLEEIFGPLVPSGDEEEEDGDAGDEYDDDDDDDEDEDEDEEEFDEEDESTEKRS